MTDFAHSFRQRLLLAAATTLVGTALVVPAMAQSAAAGSSTASPVGSPTGAPPTPQAENIVVTGSRIQRSDAKSENPVVIITSAEIAKSSAQTVEDVLKRIPAIGTSGIYGTTNNGGEGASCIDIRNLGIARTLVLVNGRRFVHSGIFGVDCVDLNNIPLSLIDRVEILKDGASALYGADAVGGVINFILKTRFNGTEVHVDGLITQAGDGREGDLGVTTGGNFNNDKGNIVVNLEYTNRAPVEQKDRSYADPVYAASPNSIGTPFNIGSGIPLGGRVFTSGGTKLALGNGVFVPYSRHLDGYDYGAQQYLQGGLEKESFTSQTHYDFTPQIQGYLETYFTHKQSRTQLAPQPVTGGLGAGLGAFIVPAGNPNNPFGEDVQLYRRVGEFGDRINEAATNTYQITGGLKGDLGYGFDYDTFFTYGRSDNTIVATNEVNYQHLLQEQGYNTDAAGNVIYDPTVCNAALGCVLSNIFGPTSLTPAAVNYARFTETATSTFMLRTFGGSVSNKEVFDLPYGPVGLALGIEHRREDGSYQPDSLVQSGVTLENAQQPTKGGFDTTEIFGEVEIPLLKDLPFAKSLSANLSGRYFDYNTFGNGETWKVGGQWVPVTGVRFRGNTGTAFRQPGVNELYGGQALSFATATDPCAQASSYGAKAGTVAANCRALGIDPNTFSQLGNGQVQSITGGNPLLQPETARTQTAGVVITPTWFEPLKDLSLTADYFRTKIASSIGAVQTQDILDGCYTAANFASPFCLGGATTRDSLQQLKTVSAINQNLGVTKTDGLDLGLNYAYPIPGYGSLSFSNQLEIVFSYVSQNLPNGPFITFNGTITPGGSALPRKRDVANITYSNGPFSFGYTMRYIQGMHLYPVAQYDPTVNRSAVTNEIFYHDITATYVYNNINVTAGIDNLFDKDPPFVLDGTTNTNPNIYDILGRVFYLKTVVRF